MVVDSGEAFAGQAVGHGLPSPLTLQLKLTPPARYLPYKVANSHL